MKKAKENFNKKLLVEGKDDLFVIKALCEKFNLKEVFDIVDCEGIDNLNDQIPVRFLQSDISTLGVIVDADEDLNKRWNSLKQRFEAAGYAIPDVLPTGGLIIKTEDKLSIGVWIMPDNDLNGMLEDFITFLVPKDDALLPIAQSALDGIESQNLNRYKPVHKSKALIHSWLSWQEDPGTPMGLGIMKRYLSTEAGTCRMLIN